MSQLQPARGTRDIYGPEAELFRSVDSRAYEISKLYGFAAISTPIFEFKDVFHRTLGETSDVVSKETYTFTDRGGEEVTLRPEGTAGIARSFISEGMAQNLPLKFYYSGPMFRYERPQKGRYRQFHQLGVESLGSESPLADIEVIALGWQIISELGLSQFCQVELNTLGDQESRQNYRQKLVEYLTPYRSQLSADSQARFEKNPMRILDSKDEGDKKILQQAPLYSQCLTEASVAFFAKIQSGLKQLGIPFSINEKLVRGLDYYCHTVFEFTSNHLGAQSAVLAGGRYDGLIEMMGGPKTPGVGWAAGIERLCLLAQETIKINPPALIAILPAEERAEGYTLKLTQELRANHLACELLTSGNMGKKMKRANKIGATTAIIIGGSELDRGVATVKNFATGEQKELPLADLVNTLKRG